jgi:phenylpropionate dioxygenase-like ring-hydroxylating dioxygenase large terminal subunit
VAFRYCPVVHRDLQIKLLRRFFEAHQARTTDLAEHAYRNPADAYTGAARAAEEQTRLFRARPLVVGLSADLPETGEYVTREVAGVPLLLVRGEDGAARCFLNACRHRGSRVATGRGRAGRSFTCPYHAWCYDIHGRLVGQPLAQDAFDELDRDGFGLVSLPAAERFGLVLVRPEAGAPIDVEAELAGLGPELGDYGFAGYRFFAEHSRSWEMNWKLGIDTFLEAYHVFSLHKATIAKDFLSTPSLHEPFGPHARLVAFRRGVHELAECDEARWELRDHASVIYRLFPNTVLNLPNDGHAELWEFGPEDGSPHRSRVSVRFYTPEAVTSERARDFWQRNVDFTLGVIFAEDFAQQEIIHANLRTGLLPEVVYGRNEPGLIHFHQSLVTALQGAAPT